MIGRHEDGCHQGEPHRHVEIQVARRVLENVDFWDVQQEGCEQHHRHPNKDGVPDEGVPTEIDHDQLGFCGRGLNRGAIKDVEALWMPKYSGFQSNNTASFHAPCQASFPMRIQASVLPHIVEKQDRCRNDNAAEQCDGLQVSHGSADSKAS